jgi:predicted O-methyltransferase YrrM
VDDRYRCCAQDTWELNELLSLLRRYRIERVLEIGTKMHGWINVIAPWTAPRCQFVCVDIRDHYQMERSEVKSNLALSGRSIQLIIGDSRVLSVLQQAQNSIQSNPSNYSTQFDLLHIDGDHSYESCKSDYELYSAIVRPGGLIVFHDIHHARDTGVFKFWTELRHRHPTPFARSWEFFHWRPCIANGDGPMGIGVIEVGQP